MWKHCPWSHALEKVCVHLFHCSRCGLLAYEVIKELAGKCASLYMRDSHDDYCELHRLPTTLKLLPVLPPTLKLEI